MLSVSYRREGGGLLLWSTIRQGSPEALKTSENHCLVILSMLATQGKYFLAWYTFFGIKQKSQNVTKSTFLTF